MKKRYFVISLVSVIITILSICTVYYYYLYTQYKGMYSYLNSKMEFSGNKEFPTYRPVVTCDIKNSDIILSDSLYLNLTNMVDGTSAKGITDIMAVKIANAIWQSQYGNRIMRLYPYHVFAKNDVWVVYCHGGYEANDNNLYMEISMKDGKVRKSLRAKSIPLLKDKNVKLNE